MCGIAGVVDLRRGVAPDVVPRMVERLVHRGPDGEGQFTEDGVGLGMRRLAIVDMEGGGQPLTSEDGNVVVVFNGEIYDHAEHRAWLAARGHRLRSGSDGEVIAHLFEEFGGRFVERLNGIFAIALWDRRERRLHLYRDRYGVKPLYWWSSGGRLAFASEIKALLADPELPRAVDPEAVDDFLTLRFVPSPRTLLRGVSKLPPASLLVAEGGAVRQERWWTGRPSAARRDRRRLVAEYRTAFERAVERQTMSDRPIGVMLSGGVDSGAITAVLAARHAEVRTFTIGFSDGGDADETALAEETARRFGTRHESLVVTPEEYLARLPDSLAMVEEPIGTSSALAVNLIAELMRPHVAVALSGQGADEPLGGYWRHLGAALAGRLAPLARVGPLLRRAPMLAGHPRVSRGLDTLAESDPVEQLLSAYRVLHPAAKARLYGAAMDDVPEAAGARAAIARFASATGDVDRLTRMLFVDTRLWLPDELLMIADKMSMAASIELRVPFLDRDLVDLVESMAPGQKVRGLSRKSIHKRAMLAYLPPQVVYRRERGWATPVGEWMRGPMRPLLEDVLLDPGGLCRELLREDELRRLVDAHATGASDHERQLLCLLSLGLWGRSFARQ